eukprot:jgi/Picre1/30089/NNA_005459.t1
MGPIKIGFYTAPKHTLPHPETHIENPERLEAMYRHVKEHALVDGVVEEMLTSAREQPERKLVESSVTDAKRAAGVVLDLVDCVCGSEEPTTKAMACVCHEEYDGIERVLLVDFDLHNGNGTAEIFWESSDVCVVDIHEKTQVYEPPEFVPNEPMLLEVAKDMGTLSTSL